jgi:hypothetical protein
MDAEIFSHLIKQIEKASENLLSNIGFISNEDAASISWVTAKRVVEFRNHALKVFNNTMSLMLKVRKMDQFNYNAINDLLFESIRSTLLLSKHIDPLREKAETIRKDSILKLTLKIWCAKTNWTPHEHCLHPGGIAQFLGE